MARPKTGHLLDSFPYVRLGDVRKQLVVIPGFGDAMFGGQYPPPAAWALQSYFHRFLDAYTVHLIGRPRGLPENYRIDDGTEQYGQILDQLPSPVDLLGISMGGCIAQELAARYPELVENLVVTSSGYRLGESGRATVERFHQLAAQQRWTQLRSELSRTLYSCRDWRRYSLPPTIQTVGRFFGPRPAVPADVSRSLSAILDYEGAPTLGDIEADTLVIGGERDPFFPASILRATAEGIPSATVASREGARHGAFDERKRLHDRQVLSFLEREAVAAD